MILGYLKANGKHPAEKKANRILLSSPPIQGDYCAAYSSDFFKLDIDDLNHKTEALENPIRGKAKSTAIIRILDELGVKYNGIRTSHGVHLFFRRPEYLKDSNNKTSGWYCPLGVKMEWKFPERDDYIPLRINNNTREFFKGSLDNTDVDELPFYLYPLQSGTKSFDMDFAPGERTQKLGGYLFYLVNKGYSAENAFEVVRMMNKYIFDNPIRESTLNAEILNSTTMEKLIAIENTNKKGADFDTFKVFLSELGMTIRYNELLNIVEYNDIPVQYADIKDVQNVMPIQLLDDFKKYIGRKTIGKQSVVDWIILESDKNSYNPVKEYLHSASWDGTDRFPRIFDILGVTSEFEQALIKKWFYQTAAIAFNTLSKPIQPEGVLILQGAEGIGKTRFFQQLLNNPLWFSSLDKELTTKNKDILIQMLSVWVAEIGEIDRTFKANKSDVKNFMTLTKDSIRKPYAREPITKARVTSFCGTTNKDEFLNDETGFRRWWVIPIKKRIDMGDFPEEENLQQFWMQCMAAVQENPQCFRLSDREKDILEDKNKEVMEMLPGEDELREAFDYDAAKKRWRWLQPSELRKPYESDYGVYQYTAKEIGAAIRAIMKDCPEIQKKRANSGIKYLLPPTKTRKKH